MILEHISAAPELSDDISRIIVDHIASPQFSWAFIVHLLQSGWRAEVLKGLQRARPQRIDVTDLSRLWPLVGADESLRTAVTESLTMHALQSDVLALKTLIGARWKQQAIALARSYQSDDIFGGMLTACVVRMCSGVIDLERLRKRLAQLESEERVSVRSSYLEALRLLCEIGELDADLKGAFTACIEQRYGEWQGRLGQRFRGEAEAAVRQQEIKSYWPGVCRTIASLAAFLISIAILDSPYSILVGLVLAVVISYVIAYIVREGIREKAITKQLASLWNQELETWATVFPDIGRLTPQIEQSRYASLIPIVLTCSATCVLVALLILSSTRSRMSLKFLSPPQPRIGTRQPGPTILAPGAASPPISSARVPGFSYANSIFRNLGNRHWTEQSGANLYRFTEQANDSQWVYLRDDSRNMNLRLPLNGGWCAWQSGPLLPNGSWTNLYNLMPIASGVSSPDSPLQLGTVAACSSVSEFGKFARKENFLPGDRLFIYAEAVGVNRGGKIDLSFQQKIVSPNGDDIFRRSIPVSLETSVASWATWPDLVLPSTMAPGRYRVEVEIRNNLTGQVGTGSTAITVSTPQSVPTGYRSEGYISWSGNGSPPVPVVIQIGEVNVGEVQGELPGVPSHVDIVAMSTPIVVLEPPSPANGWKRVVVRTTGTGQQAFLLKWTVVDLTR